jgi:hypothetical protein
MHKIDFTKLNQGGFKLITHIVFFKLKERTPEVLNKTKEVLMNLEGKIDVLKHIEVGIDVIHSERSYDLALVTKFNSLADMDAYQVHPLHKEVIQYINSVREASASVDYET